MNSNTARIIAGAGILGVWTYLVVIGKADPASLVYALQITLAGIVGHAVYQGRSQT